MNRIAQRLRWSALDAAERAAALQRPAVAAGAETLEGTRAILAEVRAGGDAALRAITARLDKADISDFLVSDAEFAAARAELSDEQIEAIRTAIANVSRYHEAQLTEPYSVETTAGVVV